MTDRAVDTRGDQMRVLQDRAALLARSHSEEVAADEVEILVIRCGANEYGCEATRVQEVHPVERLTPVPGSTDLWAGIVNVRGRLYAVVDTRRYLGLAGGDEPSDVRMVLLLASEDPFGLLVDDVLRLDRLPKADLRPPLNATGSSRSGVVSAITTGMISLIDVDALLNDPLLSTKTRGEP